MIEDEESEDEDQEDLDSVEITEMKSKFNQLLANFD